MNPVFAVFLTVLLGSSTYLAGRLHARVGYRFGYRYGYRQGYFDGDRACWNRVRRDAQADPAEVGEPLPAPVPAASAPPVAAPSLPVPRAVAEDDFPSTRAESRVEYGATSRAYHDRVSGEFAELPGTGYAGSGALGRHAQDNFVSG